MACCGQRPINWTSRAPQPKVLTTKPNPVPCCREPAKPIVNITDETVTVLCWKCKFNITELAKLAKPPSSVTKFTALTKIICPQCKVVNEIVLSNG